MWTQLQTIPTVQIWVPRIRLEEPEEFFFGSGSSPVASSLVVFQNSEAMTPESFAGQSADPVAASELMTIAGADQSESFAGQSADPVAAFELIIISRTAPTESTGGQSGTPTAAHAKP